MYVCIYVSESWVVLMKLCPPLCVCVCVCVWVLTWVVGGGGGDAIEAARAGDAVLGEVVGVEGVGRVVDHVIGLVAAPAHLQRPAIHIAIVRAARPIEGRL